MDRPPLDEDVDKGAHVPREELALGIDDGEAVLRFDHARKHLDERASVQQVRDQEPREQRNPDAADRRLPQQPNVIR